MKNTTQKTKVSPPRKDFRALEEVYLQKIPNNYEKTVQQKIKQTKSKQRSRPNYQS